MSAGIADHIRLRLEFAAQEGDIGVTDDFAGVIAEMGTRRITVGTPAAEMAARFTRAEASESVVTVHFPEDGADPVEENGLG